MASSADQREDAGHAVYTPAVLAVYDLWVLGLSNRWIWKCPTARLLELYNRHASDHHLDVGVGTGFFSQNADFRGSRRASPLSILTPIHCAGLRSGSSDIAQPSFRRMCSNVSSFETPRSRPLD